MRYWAKTFDGSPERVAEVREYVRTLLGDSEGADAVELAASELTGNALRHSRSGERGGQFTVHLAVFCDRWQVRVDDDGGPNVPHIREPIPIETIEDLDALGEEAEVGRGLMLVAAVSSAWGVLGDSAGRTVWVEILIPRKGRRESLQVSGGRWVGPSPAAAPQRHGVLVDLAGVLQTLRTLGRRRAAGESRAQSGRSSELLRYRGNVLVQGRR